MAFSHDAQFSDADCRTGSPPAFFGCSNGNDGRKIGAYGDFGSSFLVDLGMGYVWNKWLSTEISLSYRPGLEFTGESNFNQISSNFEQKVEADVESYSGMLVSVLRPMVLFRQSNWIVEPLLTAGVGFAHNRVDGMEYTFPLTMTTTPGGEHTGFAWTVGAGFSYGISQNVELELLYRYTDLGEVITDVDTMTITRRSNNSVITDSIVINKTETDLEVCELLLSLVWYY